MSGDWAERKAELLVARIWLHSMRAKLAQAERAAAQALRDTRNAALEEAARLAEIIGGGSKKKIHEIEEMDPVEAWSLGVQDGNRGAADAIRHIARKDKADG